MNSVLGHESKEKSITMLAIASSVFIFSLRDQSGSDIEIGRNHLIDGSGNNLLGAWASWFYSIFPNTFIHWGVYLSFLQVSLSALGVFLVINAIKTTIPFRYRVLYYLLTYLIVDFASQQSRDGSMMAFLVFSFGLWRYAVSSKDLGNRVAIMLLSVCSLIIGFFFRPWLVFSLLPIFCFILRSTKNSANRGVLLIMIVASPLVVENITFKALDMENWFPQQTVMIHDLTATYCWNSSVNTREIAWKGLNHLSTSNISKREICQAFKPNTWQAVVAAGSSTDSGLPPLRTLEADSNLEYEKLKNQWIAVLISDPFGYIQNHLMFSTQVLIAGEMREISLISLTKEDFYSNLRSIWKLPSELAKSLHLTSPVIAILFYAYSRRNLFDKTKSYSEPNLFAAILIVWVGITSIGYVSDNGRYTLVPVLMLYLSILTSVSRLYSLKTGAHHGA